MKCPDCGNDLIVKELNGKKYVICLNCKKTYTPEKLLKPAVNNSSREESPMVLSICSMVLGIGGLLFSCLRIGIFPAAAGLILAIAALALRHSKGMAIAGLVTSLMGILIASILLISDTEIESLLGHNTEATKESVQESKNSSKKSEKKKSSQKKDSGESEQPQPADDNMIDLDTGKYKVKYTGHALGNDYDGNPCIIIYYDFTNNSGENTDAQLSTQMKVFQNGVQCEAVYFLDESLEGNESINNYTREIQPGTAVNVGEVYAISDMSPVTVEVSEFLSWEDQKDTMVIQLQ